MRALVIGVGGLGCPASLALAAGGVKSLSLIDPDCVELSNLHRQPWYLEADIGQPKVEVAARRLKAQYPQLNVEAMATAVDRANAERLFRQHDVVLDGTDRGETKFMLSDLAVATRVPLVFGGVLRLEGLSLRIEPGHACLRCLFEESALLGPTCAQVGVLGPMAGWVGAAMAELAVSGRPGVLHRFDGSRFTRRQVSVNRASDCPACGALPRVDVTKELCPMTYVRVKLALERVPVGQRLEVFLSGAEPLKNVPASAIEEGHAVELLEPHADGAFRMVLRRGTV